MASTTVPVANATDNHEFNLLAVPYVCVLDIIAGLGLVGNILVLVLMRAEPLRCHSYAIYLCCLSVLDSLVLIMTAVEDTTDNIFHVLDDFLSSSEAVCKIWGSLLSFASLASPWLLAALTFDRFMTVVFPHYCSRVCTGRFSAIASGSLIVGSVILTIPFCIIGGLIHEKSGPPICDFYTEDDKNYDVFHLVILSNVLPVLAIFGLNIYTLVCLKRGNRYRRPVMHFSGVVSDSKEVAKGLIVVSVVSMIALFPYAITVLVEYIFNLKGDVFQSKQAGFVWYTFNVIRLLNFAMNFYVLMICDQRYRDLLVKRCFGKQSAVEQQAARLTVAPGNIVSEHIPLHNELS